MKRFIYLNLFFLVAITLSFSKTSHSQSKLANFAKSLPSLQTLENITLQRAGLDPRQIKKWEKGSKWSAALPRVQISWESKLVQQNTAIIEDNISVTSSGVSIGPESNRVDHDFADNQNFEIKALWHLEDLLFNRNQLSVSREARDLFLARQKITEELQEAYYELKSLLLEANLDETLIADPIWRLKVDRMIDKINSLTGGKFKQLLGKIHFKKNPS